MDERHDRTRPQPNDPPVAPDYVSRVTGPSRARVATPDEGGRSIVVPAMVAFMVVAAVAALALVSSRRGADPSPAAATRPPAVTSPLSSPTTAPPATGVALTTTTPGTVLTTAGPGTRQAEDAVNEADDNGANSHSDPDDGGADTAAPVATAPDEQPGGALPTEPQQSDNHDAGDQGAGGDCGVWGYQDGDGDGIGSRWDRDPCVADHVSAAAPCESYSGNPVEDPFGDWDGDGTLNGADVDPCDPGVVDLNGYGSNDPCPLEMTGTSDNDEDGIPAQWDFDPCVPDRVSAAQPCDSFNGQPGDDPTGDWDGDGVANQSDTYVCDPGQS